MQRSARLERTRDLVKSLKEQGKSQIEIARELGLTKSTVAYHFRSLGFEPDERFSRRYDWAAIQEAYDSGMSMRECCREFGCNGSSWSQAVARGDILPRPREIPLEELLVVGKKRGRLNLKRRLIDAGVKENRCEECGISEWQDKPLSMQLHHVNGDGMDNRLENIRFLCANCHSQTDSYGGRNGHRKPSREASKPA